MSESRKQSPDEARDEVAGVVERARKAASAVEQYTQQQVDALVTAVAWAVVREDRARELARLAVDEGGFGNYQDKITKIGKRVTGVLADMSGMRTVGVVEQVPEAGLVKIAKPVGVVAALIPTTGPDATPPVKTLFALKGRNAIVCAPHPRTRRTTEAVVGYMRAACEQVGAPADLVQSLAAPSLPKTQGADAAGRPDRGHRRGRHGPCRLQLGHAGLRGGRRQRRARGGRDRRPG